MNIKSVLVVLVALFAVSCTSEVEQDYKAYEVQGKVKKIVIKEGEQTVSEIAFNRLGQILYEKTLTQLMEFSYDDEVLTKLSVLNNKNELETIREYSYVDGDIVSVKEKDKNNTFTREVRYSYDENGNRVKGDLLTPYKDTLYSWKYIFNERDVLVGEQHIMYKPSFQQKDVSLTLDENDNIIGVKESESDGAVRREIKMDVFSGISLQTSVSNYWMEDLVDSTSFLYDFDEKGNWIKRTTLTRQNNEFFQTRHISYY